MGVSNQVKNIDTRLIYRSFFDDVANTCSHSTHFRIQKHTRPDTYQIFQMAKIVFILLLAVFISIQVHAARNLAEPECGCPSDLRLMYTFMEDKFTLKDEIKGLKATVDELQDKLSILQNEKKGN